MARRRSSKPELLDLWSELAVELTHDESAAGRELARRDVSEKVAGMNPEREIVEGRSELGSPRRSDRSTSLRQLVAR